MASHNEDELTADETDDLRQRGRETGSGMPVPRDIGRYRIDRVLGQGGFGIVYLARDQQLDRLVAIKVAHAGLISSPADASAYMQEARIVAQLDHPNIVPVHDVGSTPEVPFYSVSKFVDGTDLAVKLRAVQFRPRESAKLVATIAEALHDAHKRGLVHRDVKPANILLDRDGKPYLVDFGLALREAASDDSSRYVGTPTYTSPEQARGEGHRVDGRSDIFSLGVVLYEMLTRRRPFKGTSRHELLRRVASYEPKPPRQYDENIPKELERICQKAMAKLAQERYSSAHDLADDLHHFIAAQPASETMIASAGTIENRSDSASELERDATTDSLPDSGTSAAPAESSGQRDLRIVPKGIRSFDVHDSDFFLQLLPGPRDRDGLPETVRFWKTHIEARDAEQTFPVGLIYGPSGCGKSSLVKAGLLPRLSAEIVPIMIDAAPKRTEQRLRRAIEQNCPTLPQESSLAETIRSLRNGFGPAADKKILIVIDQFEQWLHSTNPDEDAQLVQALRQCDGPRVQCILMVRDDFWMAMTQFMRRLEIRISEGQNSAAVDMFPPRHAVKVLDAFGRAFGALPDDSQELTADQKQFLQDAVQGLASDGKVICVRLSLFAETMRDKDWATDTLREVGGTQGVGLTYLEETFSGPSAPPEFRYHQRAARRVLGELLPDAGTDIRQSMRSYEQLRQVSGYDDVKDFDELIEILDSVVRLITPVDPEGFDDTEDGDTGDGDTDQGQRYYQLTHDYLVHSLRSWLTRKQNETRRGRAELLLHERAAFWQAKPETRYLPSVSETARIRLLTDRQRWTASEQAVVAKASAVHARRIGLSLAALLLLLLIGGVAFRKIQRHTQAEGLVKRLESARIEQIPEIISEIEPLRSTVHPLLEGRMQAELTDDQRLRIALALASQESAQQYLVQRLCGLRIGDFTLVREFIEPRADTVDQFWDVLRDERIAQSDSYTRFQAGCAVAHLASDDERWQMADDESTPFHAVSFTVKYLLSEVPSIDLMTRLEHLRPVSDLLRPLLSRELTDLDDQNRSFNARAAIALAYFEDDRESLVDVLLNADQRVEFEPLLAALQDDVPAATEKLEEVLQSSAEPLRRRAVAAATLIHFGQLTELLPYLEHGPDPSLRSLIGHYLTEIPFDDYDSMLAAFDDPDLKTSQLRTLIQMAGGLDPILVPVVIREDLAARFADLYRHHPDPGVHSMSSLSLRRLRADPPALLTETFLDDRNQEVTLALTEWKQAELAAQSARNAADVRHREWEHQLAAGERPDQSIDANLALRLKYEDRNLMLTEGDQTRPITIEGERAYSSGIFGDSITLDESSHVDCGDIGNLDAEQKFSYGCWFNATEPWHAIFAKSDTRQGNRGFDLWLNDGHVAMHLISGEPDDYMKVMATQPVRLEKWHHVIVSYDGTRSPSGVHLYVNGVEAEVTAEVDRLTGDIDTQVPLMIGTRFGDFPLSGWVDDIRIYDRELTAADCRNIYESGLQVLARISADDRSPDQQDVLDRGYSDPMLQLAEEKLQAAQAEFNRVKWGDRLWFVNSQQQTMVVLPGHPETAVQYDFAIAAREVTVTQYRRFLTDIGSWINVDETTAPTADCPMHNMNWFEAARYCNWLSEQDGIDPEQWCFEPNADGYYGSGVTIKENYQNLRGYRFPTHAEWQHAVLGGSKTVYCFGTPDEIAGDYAWYLGNSLGRSHPVGTRLPNDFGIFDLHGNLWEFSLDTQQGESLSVESHQNRGLFGGALNSVLNNVQINSNTWASPDSRSNYQGFRVVRSLPAKTR